MVSMRIVIVAVIAILIDIAVALIIMIVSIIDSFSVLVLSSAGSRGLGACLLHFRRLRRLLPPSRLGARMRLKAPSVGACSFRS